VECQQGAVAIQQQHVVQHASRAQVMSNSEKIVIKTVVSQKVQNLRSFFTGKLIKYK
jgi:hypothetical protein